MSFPETGTIIEILQNGPNRSQISGKQLTLALAGKYIASTNPTAKPLLVWELENSYYARYYLPEQSLHQEIKEHLSDSKSNGNGQGNQNVSLGLEVSVEVIDTIDTPNGDAKALVEKVVVGPKTLTWVRFVGGKLSGFIRFERDEIDDWFENGTLFKSIKNPYKRIDTGLVSQQIVVKIDGEIVAESNVGVLLNETGLKDTYYIPATSIKNWGSVEKTDLRTICPYKGEAAYLSITVKGKKYDNFIWYYPYPTRESTAVEGLICFYNKENVDILVDGAKI